MDYFELTFRFDNEDNSLSRFNGLSIEDLAKFLKDLSRSVVSSSGNKLVLSEIKGNCYAPVVSTPSKTQYEGIKALHTEIANSNISGLNTNEINYYNTLREITKNGLILNVYDKDKTYFKSIEKLKEATVFPFFYQTNAYRGKLTRIGSRNLNTKNTIFISSYPYEIEINGRQDSELKAHYKREYIEFYITEKINKLSGKIEAAQLDDFELLKGKSNFSFLDSINSVRDSYGKYFSETINENNE